MNYSEVKNRTCSYNDYVECDRKERPCDTCGWNPSVAEARLKRYCKTNKIKMPEEESRKTTKKSKL